MADDHVTLVDEGAKTGREAKVCLDESSDELDDSRCDADLSSSQSDAYSSVEAIGEDENNEIIPEQSDLPQKDSASTVFMHRLIADGNQRASSDITAVQRDMLDRYEKTNEMLINFNSLSESRLQSVFTDLNSFSTLLKVIKVDLDRAHSRIRLLNKRVYKQYPSAYERATSEVRSEDYKAADSIVTDSTKEETNKEDSSKETNKESCKDSLVKPTNNATKNPPKDASEEAGKDNNAVPS